jgi:basic membrane protein A and related proteins
MRFSIALSVAVALCGAAETANADGLSLDGSVKPAFIYVGAKDDGGWQQAIDQARTRTESQLKTTIPYAENVSRDEEEVKATAAKLITEGHNVIVGSSASYSSTFKELAGDFPKVAFINISDNLPAAPQAPNLKSIFGRSYESQYLCGVVAGMTSNSDNIGFLATQPSGVTNWEINGYTLGVHRVKPEAVVHVKFTRSTSAASERDAATALIDQGANVIGQAIDGPTPQLVAQERGVFATGHAVDLHQQAPKSAICSSIWDWGRYLIREIKKIGQGNWIADPSSVLLGMTGGGTDIICCSSAVPRKTIPQLIAERDGIIILNKRVFAGPLKDRDGKERVPAGGALSDTDLWEMNWYVHGVVIDE